MLYGGDSNFRIGDHPTRTERESNESRPIGKMLATIDYQPIWLIRLRIIVL
jgi:hypothetical protein